MSRKRLTIRQCSNPAESDIYAAMEAAEVAARTRFDHLMVQLLSEMKALLATRQQQRLTQAEIEQLLTLQQRYDDLSAKQQHFTLADLAARMGAVRQKRSE